MTLAAHECDQLPEATWSCREGRTPFADWPRTPGTHFKLYCLAAAAHLTRQVTQSYGTREGTFAAHPFLLGYDEELAGREPDDLSDEDSSRWWELALREWEWLATTRLPLRILREGCELDYRTLLLLSCIGLVEEDARFGSLFETIHGLAGQHRPTAGLLNAWWRDEDGCGAAHARLRRLSDLGLIQFGNADAPRSEWTTLVTEPLWEILRGETQEALTSWARYRAPETLLALDELIVPDELRARLSMLPQVIAGGEAQALLVRGPQRNGRKTLLGALARSLGSGLLEISGLERKEDERWRAVGLMATLLRALPVIALDAAPGETIELPALRGLRAPVGVTLGKQGGVSGTDVERAITLTVEMPDETARSLHWQRGLDAHPTNELALISERLRLTGGNIRRVADMAAAYAALGGREEITLADAQQAARALNRQTLDTLAVRLDVIDGDWSHLAVGDETMGDLRQLENRCRERERLPQQVGAALRGQLSAGVRALFSGPSGTGKTFAARLLAASLQMDLYRLDLATVVNKYIGETEKNLSRVFSRVEELDVILLLDEGDALLTGRTQVSNSNDRYANLETNYLLQRLESFEGILIVTTNASDRIDSAFQRRMDVVIDFAPPGAQERWAIWQTHLPAAHEVPALLLREVARRCEMTGGQIRNAVLHASALALAGQIQITGAHLEAAVRREYRKLGAVCPLRAPAAVASLDRW
jgi:hypothetical protein